MKNLKLLLGVALLVPMLSLAQAEFGFKGGVNFANFTGDNTALISSRTSVHFGFMAEIGLSERFAFQPELMFSGQGAKIEDQFLGLDFIDSTTKMSYLNIPLMFKFYASEGFNFQFGPQVGFLLSAKTDVDASEIGAGTAEEDVKDLFESVDFGLNVGLGYKLESGLNFDARYNFGLTKINAVDGTGTNKNGVFQLSVGYFF